MALTDIQDRKAGEALMTQNEMDVLLMLADADRYESLRKFEREAIQAALLDLRWLREEVDRLRRQASHTTRLDH